MRCSPLLVATLLAGLALSAAAKAQITAVDEDGARQILAGFKAWYTQGRLAPEGDVTVQFDAPVSVEPVGNRYQVDLPPTTIGVRRGNSVRMGETSMTLTPTARGWFDMTVQIPQRFVFVGGDTGPLGEMTIGSQRGSGLFVPALQTFVASDFFFESIRIVPYDLAGEIAIGQVGMVGDFIEDEPGRSDMDFDFFIRNVESADIGDAHIALSEIMTRSTLEAMRLDDYLAFVEEANVFFEAPETQHGLEPPEAVAGLARLIAETPALAASIDFEFGVSGLAFSAPGFPAQVTLDNVSLQGSSSGSDEGTHRLGLRFELDALNVPNVPLVSQMLPSHAILDYDVLGIDESAIVNSLILLLNVAPSAVLERAAEGAARSLSDAILHGGGELRLNTLDIVSETMSLKADGLLEADPDGLVPFRLEATIELGGLSMARAALLPWMDNENASAALGVLETIGEAVTDARGRDVLRYQVLSTPQGSVTINGQEADDLLRFLDVL